MSRMMAGTIVQTVSTHCASEISRQVCLLIISDRRA